MAVHGEDDPAVGQPLCPDCYDYPWQVVWQWWAPELWRRFTITLRRLLAHHLGTTAGRLGRASLQYAKVAEYQLRGAVHFHALVRLDGPQTADGFAPAPAVTALPVHADDGPRVRLRTRGRHQVGVRTPPHRRPGPVPDPEQVAGYLAKYATKSTGDTETKDNAHLRRLEAIARHLAGRAVTLDEDGEAPYGLLGKWAHTLGFRGHFATKSRRYSVTLGQSAAPASAPVHGSPRPTGPAPTSTCASLEVLADEDDETTVVIGSWTYVGSAGRTAARPPACRRGPCPRVRPGAGSTPTRADEEEPRDE